jgi:oligopeptide transport system substrate-binding protein
MRLALCALVASCAVLFSSCTRRELPVDAATSSHTLLLGNLAEPSDLDPQIDVAYTDQNILMALFEGLTALDEKTSLPVPAVAERWDVSPDGLVYTFHLRSNARWSSGDPITADDFVYSFRRILAPALAAEYSYMLWPIRNAEAFNTGKLINFADVGVAAVDASTLRITLQRPTPYLLSLAAHPTWFPVQRETIEKFGHIDQRSTPWTRPGNLVGNGAFLLSEWSPNSRIIVSKNPRYWDAAHTGLERVIFYPTEKPDDEERGFRAGQVHLTYGIPIDKIARFRNDAPAELRLDPFLQTHFLRFNVTKPPLNNPKVRRALALAIDRDSISHHILRDSRPVATHFTPSDCAGYTARASISTDYAEARRLLDEAGFPGGKGLPVFDLQVLNDDVQPKVTEAIQAMWLKELGVHIAIAPFEQKTWVQNQQSLNYTISFASWAGDFVDPSTFLDLFVKQGGNNWTGWGDADYDAMILEAARTLDPAARFEVFQKAEALLLAQSPITPLYFGARTYLISPVVKNWQPSLLGFHRYQEIRLEKP